MLGLFFQTLNGIVCIAFVKWISLVGMHRTSEMDYASCHIREHLFFFYYHYSGHDEKKTKKQCQDMEQEIENYTKK